MCLVWCNSLSSDFTTSVSHALHVELISYCTVLRSAISVPFYFVVNTVHMFSILMSQWNVSECWDRLYPLQLHQMEQLSALLLPSATGASPFDGESLSIWISICAWFQTNLHLCSWVVSWRRTVTALGFLDFCDFSDTSLNWLSTFTNCTNNLLSDKKTNQVVYDIG